jgi:hypothetical protein
LKRGEPLKRTSSLKPGEPLKRTEWKSKPCSSVAPRSKQLAMRSKTSKRGREQAQRAEFVAKMIAEANGLCQAWYQIRMVDFVAARNCLRLASEVHEPLTRGRGGSILDPENSVPICRNCHMWIDDNKQAATSVGLLRHGR